MKNFKTNPPKHTPGIWAARLPSLAFWVAWDEQLQLMVPHRRLGLSTRYAEWKPSQNFGEVA